MSQPKLSNNLTVFACEYSADGTTFDSTRFYIRSDGSFGSESASGDKFYVHDALAYSVGSDGRYLSIQKGRITGGYDTTSYGAIDFDGIDGVHKIGFFVDGIQRASVMDDGIHDKYGKTLSYVYLPTAISSGGAVTGSVAVRIEDGIVRPA